MTPFCLEERSPESLAREGEISGGSSSLFPFRLPRATIFFFVNGAMVMLGSLGAVTATAPTDWLLNWKAGEACSKS